MALSLLSYIFQINFSTNHIIFIKHRNLVSFSFNFKLYFSGGEIIGIWMREAIAPSIITSEFAIWWIRHVFVSCSDLSLFWAYFNTNWIYLLIFLCWWIQRITGWIKFNALLPVGLWFKAFLVTCNGGMSRVELRLILTRGSHVWHPFWLLLSWGSLFKTMTVLILCFAARGLVF